jgi:alpha-beta hydrolase superfamily lysophospholipase
MPFLDDARSVYYRVWRAESPRATIVLLHGFGEHTGHYHRLAFALNAHGYDVWGLDHTGHGLSAGERGLFPSVTALAENASLLADLAESGSPRLPIFLVGHSLGGITAALIAVGGRKIDGLVLTGTPLSGLPAHMEDNPIMSNDAFYLDALANDPLTFDTVPAEDALWTSIAACEPGLRSGLPALDVPTLFVNGDHDVFAPLSDARAWAAQMPRAEVVEITDGHHDIVNDVAHRQVADAIASFIKKHSTVTASL